jgi:hypothetical protein
MDCQFELPVCVGKWRDVCLSGALSPLPPCTCSRQTMDAPNSWNPNGTVINAWDASYKGFVLNRTMVRALQDRGVSVHISLGGEREGRISADAPPTFSDTLAAGAVRSLAGHCRCPSL